MVKCLSKVILITLSILFGQQIFGQTRIETSKYLFWQPETSLKYSDFQNQQMYDGTSQANLIFSVKILSVLEYPQDTKEFRNSDAKWYLAPAFDKNFSIFTEPNEVDLQQAQIYFDVSEYWVRISRNRIMLLQKQDLENNFDVADFYKKELDIQISESAIQNFSKKLAEGKDKAFSEIFEDIIEIMFMQREKMGMDLYLDSNLGNKVDVIKKWREKIDTLLGSTQQYSTKFSDCERFINDKPFYDNNVIIYMRE